MSDQLQAKIDELAFEQASLADAQNRMDVDAEVAASQRINILESQVERLRNAETEANTATASERAKDRLAAIPSKVDELVATMTEQLEHAKAAKQVYERELQALNEYHAEACTLAAEASALCDRFELPKPVLQAAPTPAYMGLTTLPSVVLSRELYVQEETEADEYEMRQRRTYSEVRGTEAASIIDSVGLKPFPALTPRQQQVIGQRSDTARREREQMALDS